VDTDAEQGIEGSMACPAPIEAEHEFVEVVLKVCSPQSVINPRPHRLRLKNIRWIQGGPTCAATGPSVTALCLTLGMSCRRAKRR
jgi:hypothetical protein